MTANRDQDVHEYAKSLGYTYLGVNGNGHREYVHKITGKSVTVSNTASEYRSYLNTMADMREGAGLSNKGRPAVVNSRRTKKPKRGENSARLERERVARDRAECLRRAELQAALEAKAKAEEAARVVAAKRATPALARRLRELSEIQGLMQGG